MKNKPVNEVKDDKKKILTGRMGGEDIVKVAGIDCDLFYYE